MRAELRARAFGSLQLAERHLQIDGLSRAEDAHGHGLADSGRARQPLKQAAAVDGLALEADDDVADLDLRLVGGAARLDLLDDRALFRRRS